MEKQRERGQLALLLLPSTLWLGLFFLAPLGIILVISLVQRGGPVAWQLDGSAYVRLLDPLHLKIFLRSLTLAVLTTFVCLLVGYPLAYYIAQRPPRLRHLLHFFVLLPLWANSLVLTYAWMVLLRPEGFFDSLLHALGFAEPISLLYTPTAVVIGLVYWYLPFMVYPLYGSIEKFDFTLIEAAHDLGATRFQAFRKVLLPLTMPGVMAGSLLVFISALGTFVVPALLGGDKTLMWGNLIQQRFLSTPQDWPLGAALSLAMMLFMSVGIWFYFRVNRESA